MDNQVKKKRQKKTKKPPVLFNKTQKIIKQLAKDPNTAFITYWASPSASIYQSDVVVVYEILRHIGKTKKIVLFVKSNGGSGRASLRLIHLLRQFSSHITAVVPLICASAATMLVLGADEIHMGPLAYLTAVDTSLTHDLSPTDIDNDLVSVSQDELQRVLNLWKRENKDSSTNPYQALFKYIHPLVIGAVDRASSLSIQLCEEILSYHMKDLKKRKEISQHLNSNYPSHSYPITYKEAKKIGLKVKTLEESFNDSLIELNELYSEMGQKALTDFNEHNYHNNEILTIIESKGIQLFYQIDKDWHYRKEERRWVSLNDKSSWRKVEKSGRKITSTVFHIR